MAQFVEVMKQARRICDCHTAINKDYCEGCLLETDYGGCMFDLLEKVDPEIIERRIVDWAAEHPEPVYPSWYQYQETTFPGHTRWICPMAFGVECPSKSTTDAHTCKVCRNNPIPAEIAEKLGIKPKEEA